MSAAGGWALVGGRWWVGRCVTNVHKAVGQDGVVKQRRGPLPRGEIRRREHAGAHVVEDDELAGGLVGQRQKPEVGELPILGHFPKRHRGVARRLAERIVPPKGRMPPPERLDADDKRKDRVRAHEHIVREAQQHQQRTEGFVARGARKPPTTPAVGAVVDGETGHGRPQESREQAQHHA